jgi:hypothetical protein
MIGGIWRFLKEPANLTVLTAIGAGAWAAFVYFHPAPETKPPPIHNQIEADCGSVAIGGDVSGATTIGHDSGRSWRCDRKARPERARNRAAGGGGFRIS